MEPISQASTRTTRACPPNATKCTPASASGGACPLHAALLCQSLINRMCSKQLGVCHPAPAQGNCRSELLRNVDRHPSTISLSMVAAAMGMRNWVCWLPRCSRELLNDTLAAIILLVLTR